MQLLEVNNLLCLSTILHMVARAVISDTERGDHLSFFVQNYSFINKGTIKPD